MSVFHWLIVLGFVVSATGILILFRFVDKKSEEELRREELETLIEERGGNHVTC